jgi:hypothetical protein
MEDIMQALYFQKKGAYLNTMEMLCVHKEASVDNQLNDRHAVFPNIFLTLSLKMKTL